MITHAGTQESSIHGELQAEPIPWRKAALYHKFRAEKPDAERNAVLD